MHYPFNPNSHYNKLGYYQVGQYKTYSKVDALDESAKTAQPVQWIFNDDRYATLDWTVEPQVSLRELYKIRAQQIRDQYDYVVLLYSGGADSHNTLMSFLSNDIFVDEVVHLIQIKGDDDPDSFANAEIFKVAWPTAKNLIERYNPSIKHQVIDISEIILELDKNISAEEYLGATCGWMTPFNIAMSFLRKKIRGYLDIIDSGRKLCFVWGADKPGICTLDDPIRNVQHYGVYFSDRVNSIISGQQKYFSNPWDHDEFFYWGADLPELVCKQAHILKRLLTLPANQVLPGHFNPSNDQNFLEFGWNRQQGIKYTLGRDIGHTAIYPYWDPSTFSVGKTTSRVFSDRDMWLFRDIRATGAGQMFKSVVQQASKNSFWLGLKQGFPSSTSRIYCLDKVDDISKYHIDFPIP